MKNRVVVNIIFAFTVGVILFFCLNTVFNPGDVKVSMRFKTDVSDSYQVYLSPGLNFAAVELKEFKVDHTQGWQTINLTVPYSKDLSRLRIDFGDKPLASKVLIDYISILHNDQTIKIKSEHFKEVFELNEFCQYDSATSCLNTLVLNDRSYSHDAFIISKPISYLLANFHNSFPFRTMSVCFLLFFALCFHLTINTEIDITRYFSKKYFITLFIVLLMAPGFFDLFYDEPVNQENRTIATKPEFSIQNMGEYAKKFDDYMSDNFGMRNYFVESNADFRSFFFNSAVKPDKALLGKEGWMFLFGNHQNINLSRIYLYRNSLSNETLKFWVQNYETRQKELGNRGIKHYKFIAPNTHTIYPEFLPSRVKRAMGKSGSELDQVLKYITITNSPFRIIDVRNLFLELKKEHVLYRKLDSHWNSIGAFYAYREIVSNMKDSFSKLKVPELEEYNIGYTQSHNDLIPMLRFKYADFSEEIPLLQLKSPKAYTESKELNVTLTSCTSAPCKSTLLVFCDSYADVLAPFFSTGFKKVIYIKSPYNMDAVNQYKPNLVLECNVERFLFIDNPN